MGVQYSQKGSANKRRICKTAGSYGSFINIRRGVAVSKLTVSSVANWVVGLEFTLTDGRVASCKAKSFSIAANATPRVYRATATGTTAATAAAGEHNTAAAAAATEADKVTVAVGATADLSKNVIHTINNLPGPLTNTPGKPRCYPGCSPDVCSRCSQRPSRRVFLGPDSLAVLGSIGGLCQNRTGYFRDALREMTPPCWLQSGAHDIFLALTSIPR